MGKTLSRKQLLTYGIAGLILVLVGIGVGYRLVMATSEEISTGSQTQFLMDTTVDIKATGPNAEEAITKAFAEMERVEQQVSRYSLDSEVTKINENAGDWVEVSQETVDLIAKGLEISELSNGAFDITVGQLVTLWGFGTGKHRVPSDDEITAALATVDYTRVELNQDTNEVRIPEDTILDLGGFAKGYAVDQGAQSLVQDRISSGLVNAGGDISSIGTKPDGAKWRVGIQDPRERSGLLRILPLSDRSVVTSGDYERYFLVGDKRYHHIIDPRTGYPAAGLTSVSIIAKTALEGDALSTAVFVLGKEAGIELIEELPDIEGVVVDSNGEIWVSPGLRDEIITP